MERRIADDEIVVRHQPGGDIAPVVVQLRRMRDALQIAPRQRQRARLGFVQIQHSDLGAPRQHFGR